MYFLHPRRHPVAFALAVLFVLACLYIPDLYLRLEDRGYFTFGLPGPLPQAQGRPVPTTYTVGPLSLLDEVTIDHRSQDSEPLRLGEVFQDRARKPSHEDITFSLRGVRLDSRCAGAVWGQRLRADLRGGGCSQIVRGLYVDMENKLIGFVAVLNMRDADTAERIAKVLDPEAGAGFVLPLRGDGPLARLGRGYSRCEGEPQGHFVFLTWVQRFDGAGPKPLDNDADKRLTAELVGAGVALEDAEEALRERRLSD